MQIPRASRRVESGRARWPALLLLAGLVYAGPARGRAADAPAGDPPFYVGAKTCKKCHYAQHRSWQQSRMARAFESLEPGTATTAKRKAGLDPDRDYTTDPECLRCHTTGYGQPGGFVSLEETPELAGVGCEACHGPGTEFLKVMTLQNKDHLIAEMHARGLVYPPKEYICLPCHGPDNPFTAEVDPRFAWNFEERVRNIEGTHAHRKLSGNHRDLAELDTVYQ